MLFKRAHRERRWENQSAKGKGVEDLDLAEIISAVAEAIRTGQMNEPIVRDPKDLLRGLGLLRRVG